MVIAGLRLLVAGSFLLVAETELLAVYPTPSYGTYPCASPMLNCQGGTVHDDLQVKGSERSSRSTCLVVEGPFGGYCQGSFQGGTCPGSFQWCQSGRAPQLGLISHSQVSPGEIQLEIPYDFPNNYCQVWEYPATWPIIGTQNTRLKIVNGHETYAVFENGIWKPTIPCSAATVPFTITIEATCGFGPVSRTFTVTSCDTPDRDTCPAGGGGGAGTGVGLPINVGSGDVTTTIPLFNLQQSPLSLVFDLTYHSSAYSLGVIVPEPVGKGWTHPFNQVLVPIPSTNRLYHYTADGREHEYTQDGSVWQASRPAELRGTVAQVGGEYRLTRLDGTVTAFDGTTGHWLSTTDRWGNAITGTYSGLVLTVLTDSVGRQVALSYAGSQLTGITLPGGETWRFGYTGSQLTSIFDPIHTGALVWRTLAYQGTSQLLTGVSDEAGKLLEGHAYDAKGRGITSYSEGGEKNHVLVEYDEPLPGRRRVTHRIDSTTNQVSVFTLVYRGGRWLPVQIEGPCSTCGGASGDTQAFTYFSDNRVETVTDGRGTRTRFAYDANGNLTSRIEAEGTSLARTTTWDYGYAAWPSFWTTKTEPSVVTGPRTTTRAWGSGETTLTLAETGYVSDSTTGTYTTVQTFDARHRLTMVDGRHGHDGLHLLS